MFTPKVPRSPVCLLTSPQAEAGAVPVCICLALANCLINSCVCVCVWGNPSNVGDIFHAGVSKLQYVSGSQGQLPSYPHLPAPEQSTADRPGWPDTKHVTKEGLTARFA